MRVGQYFLFYYFYSLDICIRRALSMNKIYNDSSTWPMREITGMVEDFQPTTNSSGFKGIKSNIPIG